MSDTLNEYELIEADFALNLVRFLKFFNMTESNMSHGIARLVNYGDRQASYPLLDRLSAHAKLDVFRELVFYKFSESNAQIVIQADEWLRLASKTKAVRNQYIHGYWDIVPYRNKAPISFHPTNWTAGVGRPQKSSEKPIDMELTEFKVIVDEVEAVFYKGVKLLDNLEEAMRAL